MAFEGALRIGDLDHDPEHEWRDGDDALDAARALRGTADADSWVSDLGATVRVDDEASADGEVRRAGPWRSAALPGRGDPRHPARHPGGRGRRRHCRRVAADWVACGGGAAPAATLRLETDDGMPTARIGDPDAVGLNPADGLVALLQTLVPGGPDTRWVGGPAALDPAASRRRAGDQPAGRRIVEGEPVTLPRQLQPLVDSRRPTELLWPGRLKPRPPARRTPA